MGNLVVVAFDKPHDAEEVRLKLENLQSEGLLDLADVVVAEKDETGKAKLHHAGNLINETTFYQGFMYQGKVPNLCIHELIKNFSWQISAPAKSRVLFILNISRFCIKFIDHV